MRIAISVQSMEVGGVTSFTLHLANFFRDAGHEIMVLSQNKGQFWHLLSRFGLKHQLIPKSRLDCRSTRTRRFASKIKAYAPEVLLINNGGFNEIPIAAMPLLLSSVRILIVLHNHDDPVYELASRHPTCWDYAVAVSPLVERTARDKFPDKRITCIPNAVQISPLERIELDHDPSAGPCQALRLLFVGRVDDHQKGVFRLPLILAQCRERGVAAHLTIIGDGKDAGELSSRFDTADVSELVNMMGFLPNDQTLEQMRRHHVLLMPSNFEGLPIALLEAMAQGCVPVVSRLPGITDQVVENDASGFLMEADDISGYVDAIARLTDEALRLQMRTAAHQVVSRRYSIEVMGREYLRLIEELVHGGGLENGDLDAQPGSHAARHTFRQTGRIFGWKDYLPDSIRSRMGRVHARWRGLTDAKSPAN